MTADICTPDIEEMSKFMSKEVAELLAVESISMFTAVFLYERKVS